MALYTGLCDVIVATAGRAQLDSLPDNVWVADYLPGKEAAARSALVTVCDSAGPSINNDSWPRRDELPYRGLNSAYCDKGSIGSGLNGCARSEAEFWANKAAARVCAWCVVGEMGFWEIKNGNRAYRQEDGLRDPQ